MHTRHWAMMLLLEVGLHDRPALTAENIVREDHHGRRLAFRRATALVVGRVCDRDLVLAGHADVDAPDRDGHSNTAGPTLTGHVGCMSTRSSMSHGGVCSMSSRSRPVRVAVRPK